MKNNYNRMYNDQRGERTNTPVIDEGVPNDVKKDLEDALQNKETPAPKELKTYEVVNCSNLNVREKADRTSPVKCLLKAGETVNVESISDGWAHVYTSKGIEGYVMKEFVEEV